MVSSIADRLKKVSAIHMRYRQNKTIAILAAILKKVSAIPSIAILYRDINSPDTKSPFFYLTDSCIHSTSERLLRCALQVFCYIKFHYINSLSLFKVIHDLKLQICKAPAESLSAGHQLIHERWL